MNDALAPKRAVIAAISLGLLVVVLGCSGRPKNVARRVTGKVTLGGQPLAKALVTFTPTDKGSPSFAVTDDTGTYTLVWAQKRGAKIEGAQIGEHVVRITTMGEADPDADPPIAATPEKVPYKYRQEGGAPKVTVKKGSNTIDIALEAGPVEPPQPKGKGKGKKAAAPECY